METPLVQISQGGKDIGWGKLGSIMPDQGEGAEITLNDVHIADGVEFEIGGPFRIAADEKRFENCTPVNFRNLRPGCDYDWVIFTTEHKPKIG